MISFELIVNNILILVLIVFCIHIVAQFVLVQRLSDQYPETYRQLGSPWSFWTGPRNFRFDFFILSRGFVKYKFDSKTIRWCNIASISLSLFFLLIVSMIFL